MPGPEAALAALIGLGALLAACLRPPAPKPVTAPAAEFSAGRALRLLERLLAEGVPHPTGTAANAVVRDRVVAELEGHGYAVEVQRAFSCRAGLCAYVENIVTRVAGSAAAGGGERSAVMLASHYDSRGAGVGAGDAGAAVAAILEVARIVRAEAPFRNDVILLLTDGEELGLLGAEAFVREHPWAADVALVINLEARGTSGPSIMFETSAENRWLVREFGRAVSRPVASSLTYDVYRLLPNDTDATVFRRVGMDVLNFAFIGGLVRYHTVRDDVAHLDRGSLQHHGDNALATVRHFASIPLERSSARGDAAYADLFGRYLVHWPASWQLVLSVVLALLVVVAAVLFVARGRTNVAALAWGALATSLGLIAAVVFGFAFGALLAAVTGRPGIYHAYPQPASVALWGGALVIVLGTGLLLGRRGGFAGLFAGGWLVLGLLTIAVSAVLPGAAVVLVIPLAIGAPAVVAAALLPGDRAGGVAVMLACLGAALTLVPLALLLQSAFVLQMPFAISAVVALGALPLLPLMAAPAHAVPRLRIALVAGAAIVIVAAVAALVVPGYSRAAPEPMNIAYMEDEAAGGAAWVVQGLRTSAAALPPDLQNVMQFRDPPAPDWAPPFIRGPWAPAPAAGLAQPRIDVLSERVAADGSGRILMLRLVPSAAGDRLVLMAPAGGSAQFGGTRVPPARSRAPGRDMWVVDGAPAEGTEVTLALRTGAPGEVALYAFRGAAVVRGDSPGAARPETAVPFGDGDVAISVVRRVF